MVSHSNVGRALNAGGPGDLRGLRGAVGLQVKRAAQGVLAVGGQAAAAGGAADVRVSDAALELP